MYRLFKKRTNPMRDSYHTGIGTLDDIKLAEEVFVSS